MKNKAKQSKGGKRAGAGRRKGVPNKITADLKVLILGALEDAGGRKFLAECATENTAAFLALVGKVLPLQVTGEGGGPVRVEAAWLSGRSL